MTGDATMRRVLTRTGVVAMAFAVCFALGAARLRAADAVASIDAGTNPGLSALVASASPASETRGIAEFSAVPSAAQVAALRALGLTVQPMHHLPLALVAGTVAQMQSAVTSGAAEDVYP